MADGGYAHPNFMDGYRALGRVWMEQQGAILRPTA